MNSLFPLNLSVFERFNLVYLDFQQERQIE